MDCSTPGLPVHHQLPEFTQTQVHELMMLSNHLIFWHPLLLLPSIFTRIRVFSNKSVLHIRWAKFHLQHQSFQWIFRTDFHYDELVGSPCSPRDSKSLLKHHSPKASILQHSAFFIVQLSHPYMTTGKTIALLAKYCLCFLICCLGWSQLFFQGASIL